MATTCGRLGLNPWAKNLIRGEQVLVCTEEVAHIYPDGRREVQKSKKIFESSVKRKESGDRCPRYLMFDAQGGDDSTEPLYIYTLPDGKVYYERYHKASIPGWEFDYLVLANEAGIVEESRWTLDDVRKEWPGLYKALKTRGYSKWID